MIYLSDSDDGAAGNGGQQGDKRDAVDLVSPPPVGGWGAGAPRKRPREDDRWECPMCSQRSAADSPRCENDWCGALKPGSITQRRREERMRRAAQAENTGSGEGGAARKRNGASGVDARGGTPNVEVVTIDDDGPADVRASVEGVVESPPELPPRPSSLSGLEGSAGARLSVSGTRKGSAFLCSRASSLSAEGRAREAVGESSQASQDSQASKPSKAALKAKLRRPAERCDCSAPGVQVFRGRFDRRLIEDKREEGQGRHAAEELRDLVLLTCKCA